MLQDFRRYSVDVMGKIAYQDDKLLRFNCDPPHMSRLVIRLSICRTNRTEEVNTALFAYIS